MKPIIFVRVADMMYYQGITKEDQPHNGGSFVSETGWANECYNFAPIRQNGEDFDKCIGFLMMVGNGVNQLHIEKIPGCKKYKKEEEINGVTVVFVSKAINSRNMRVVGFYKNAKVYRYPHIMTFENGYEQEYLFETKKDDCVVLPYSTRFESNSWYVPSSRSKYSEFGFGRSHVWYVGAEGASEKEMKYVERMIQAIENYDGDNWIDRSINDVPMTTATVKSITPYKYVRLV